MCTIGIFFLLKTECICPLNSPKNLMKLVNNILKKKRIKGCCTENSCQTKNLNIHYLFYNITYSSHKSAGTPDKCSLIVSSFIDGVISTNS